MGPVAVIAWALAGCAAPIAPGGGSGTVFTVDDDLVVDGLDGLALSGEGYWVREHIVWTDGSNPEEVENHLVLAADVDPCAQWTDTTTATYETTGDPQADCEAYQAYFSQLSANHPVAADALWIEFDLWDTRDDVEPHIAVTPVAGTFTSLDGPDADVLEYAFWGQRSLSDWNADVAAALDCTAADPWANVPDEELSSTQYAADVGSLILSSPQPDLLPFELDGVALTVSGGADGPGGTLDGSGVFYACDVTREITPSPTYDEY